jgi:hypothetical protein
MSERITRNLVVKRLGTPDETAGSLNEPVLREENGIRYNEKWIYSHLHDDPAGAAQRIVYWHRYDFTGTLIRASTEDVWQPDTTATRWAEQGDDRLAVVANEQPTLPGNPHYHPVSRVRDSLDLGGHIEGESE